MKRIDLRNFKDVFTSETKDYVVAVFEGELYAFKKVDVINKAFLVKNKPRRVLGGIDVWESISIGVSDKEENYDLDVISLAVYYKETGRYLHSPVFVYSSYVIGYNDQQTTIFVDKRNPRNIHEIKEGKLNTYSSLEYSITMHPRCAQFYVTENTKLETCGNTQVFPNMELSWENFPTKRNSSFRNNEELRRNSDYKFLLLHVDRVDELMEGYATFDQDMVFAGFYDCDDSHIHHSSVSCATKYVDWDFGMLYSIQDILDVVYGYKISVDNFSVYVNRRGKGDIILRSYTEWHMSVFDRKDPELLAKLIEAHQEHEKNIKKVEVAIPPIFGKNGEEEVCEIKTHISSKMVKGGEYAWRMYRNHMTAYTPTSCGFSCKDSTRIGSDLYYKEEGDSIWIHNYNNVVYAKFDKVTGEWLFSDNSSKVLSSKVIGGVTRESVIYKLNIRTVSSDETVYFTNHNGKVYEYLIDKEEDEKPLHQLIKKIKVDMLDNDISSFKREGVVLHLEDSYAVPNCVAGTDAWVLKNIKLIEEVDGEKFLDLEKLTDEVFQELLKDDNFKRVVISKM